jgi:hypothetical protein
MNPRSTRSTTGRRGPCCRAKRTGQTRKQQGPEDRPGADLARDADRGGGGLASRGLHRGPLRGVPRRERHQPQPQGADRRPPEDADPRARSASSRCGSASGTAPSTRWKRSARASRSPASASARSRRRRSGSCATPPAPASSRPSWRAVGSSPFRARFRDSARGSSAPFRAVPRHPEGLRLLGPEGSATRVRHPEEHRPRRATRDPPPDYPDLAGHWFGRGSSGFWLAAMASLGEGIDWSMPLPEDKGI